MDHLVHIEQRIAALKNPTHLYKIERIPIQKEGENSIYLRPVLAGRNGVGAIANDAGLMTTWRNVNKTSFFTWIDATEEGTREWLDQQYSNNNLDIIFMLETPDEVPFGHVALNNFSQKPLVCEFGRVLRGDTGGPSGGMTIGAIGLLCWAVVELQIRTFFLEVFADNVNAISFYKRIGFAATDRFALKCVESNGFIRWERLSEKTYSSGVKADCFALRMEIASEEIVSRYSRLQIP